MLLHLMSELQGLAAASLLVMGFCGQLLHVALLVSLQW